MESLSHGIMVSSSQNVIESGSHGDIQPKEDSNEDPSRKPVLIMTPYTMTPCYGAMVSWCCVITHTVYL